jgi:hypothetical protein
MPIGRLVRHLAAEDTVELGQQTFGATAAHRDGTHDGQAESR